VTVYTWLDPQKKSYGFGFGYGSLWSLARRVHAPGRGCPPLPRFQQLKKSAAPSVAPLIIILNVRRGGCLHHQVSTMDVGKYRKQICILCRAWVMGRASGRCHFSDYRSVPVVGTVVGRVLVWWLWWRGDKLQLRKKEIVLVASLVFGWWLFSVVSQHSSVNAHTAL
jgi:hypothetical protein